MYNGVYVKSKRDYYPHRFCLKKEYMNRNYFDLKNDRITITYRDLMTDVD